LPLPHRHQGHRPQAFLLFLIMRCTATIRELIEATPLSLSSLGRLPVSRLLPPRSGLERSDFVLWRKAAVRKNVRSWTDFPVARMDF
jgi:hypothetical protein